MDSSSKLSQALETSRASSVATTGAPITATVSPASEAAAAFQPSDIVMMDAVALNRAIHSRRVSCVEVMTAYLDHIDRLNPKVNAIVALQERSGLMAHAAERDAQLARGDTIGPLHGFPHAVKDLQPVKGIRSTQGSLIFKDFIPQADSLTVERLRKAGAIIIGKTNVPEFGLGSHTYNPVYGATRNAYDQSHSAGGSSGGAAVALALRMLPLADGSDYGGSLRNPAGWNNVLGFRTSIGRVPVDVRDVWLPSIGVQGPMARNAPDLAMLLSVQAGFDSRAPLSTDRDGSAFRASFERSLKGKRIAWVGDFKGYPPYEPGVLEVCKAALKTFETFGCSVEEAQPDYPLDAVWRALIRIRGWQTGWALLEFYNDPVKRALLKPEAIYEIEIGMKQSAYDITAASVVRSEWYQAVRRLFDRCDYLVAPTAQVFPFDVDLHWPEEIAGARMETYHEWMKAALLISMSGCPALAVPAGFGASGLPMGIQIGCACPPGGGLSRFGARLYDCDELDDRAPSGAAQRLTVFARCDGGAMRFASRGSGAAWPGIRQAVSARPRIGRLQHVLMDARYPSAARNERDNGGAARDRRFPGNPTDEFGANDGASAIDFAPLHPAARRHNGHAGAAPRTRGRSIDLAGTDNDCVRPADLAALMLQRTGELTE
jgi:amidase